MIQGGAVPFGLSTAAYQELERSNEWRWARQERIGANDAMQYVGPGEETISLSGAVYPGQLGDAGTLGRLRLQASLGLPLPLIGGTGRVFGMFVLESLSEGQTIFAVGGVARRIDFSMQLGRYDGGLGAILRL